METCDRRDRRSHFVRLRPTVQELYANYSWTRCGCSDDCIYTQIPVRAGLLGDAGEGCGGVGRLDDGACDVVLARLDDDASIPSLVSVSPGTPS